MNKTKRGVLLNVLLGALLVIPIDDTFPDKGVCFPGRELNHAFGTHRFYACQMGEKGFKWVETRGYMGKLLRVIVPNKESGEMIIRLKYGANIFEELNQ